MNTPTVFAGPVVKIATISLKAPSGDIYKDRLILFEVKQSYRGSAGKAAEVVTGSGGTDCGYNFREGEDYLVYAYPHPESGKLYTGICQRTRAISEAGDDLDYLSKKDEASQGAGIEGRILELTRDSRYETRHLGIGRMKIRDRSIRVANECLRRIRLRFADGSPVIIDTPLECRGS